MTVFQKTIALTVATAAFALPVLAQGPHGDDHHDDHHGYVQHKDWHKGAKISHDDWNRGAQVDWRSHHLHQPPNGYEWREVDGNYVLAAAATGLIASAIIASSAH